MNIRADFLKRLAGVATVALVIVTSSARAENGVTADKIIFGQAAALDGPAAALGQNMREGILAAFNEANRAGGVKGHMLELLSRDDGYDPNKSIQAAKQLMQQDKVFALIGAVGTPTSSAVQPIASEAGVPFIGAFTGAEFLRTPYKPSVVNVRASYFQETETMVEHLTKDLGISRIAIFYQDDGFGQAGLAGVKRALDRRKMALVAEGAYERNTTAVKRALLTIREGKPEAVIMIGAYHPCAEFIKVARQIKFDPVFVNISFVGSDALAKELGHDGNGVVVTQVVPFPTDTSIGLVAHYQAAQRALKPDAVPSFVSLEGYMVGRMVVMALQKMPGNTITRANLLDVISHSSFDLGGITLSYGPDNNRGSDRVFLTVIQSDGRFRPVERLTRVGS